MIGTTAGKKHNPVVWTASLQQTEPARRFGCGEKNPSRVKSRITAHERNAREKNSRWTGPEHTSYVARHLCARARVENCRREPGGRRTARTAATGAIAATTVPANRSVSAQRTAAASSPPRDGVFFFFFHYA